MGWVRLGLSMGSIGLDLVGHQRVGEVGSDESRRRELGGYVHQRGNGLVERVITRRVGASSEEVREGGEGRKG